MTGTTPLKRRGVAFLQRAVAFGAFGGSSHSFFVPPCGGRNGRGAGHQGGGLGVVQRPQSPCGALPASIRSRLTGDRGCRPLPCSPPIRSPSGRRVVGIAKGGTSRQLSRAATRRTLRNQAADMLSASPLHPDPSSFRGRQWGSESGGVQSLLRRLPLIGTGTGGLRGLRNTVQPPRCSCLPRPRRVLPAPRCLIGDRHVVGARHPYGVRAVGGPLGARPEQAADVSSASP